MLYQASRYEERVGEVFESRVTRLNVWKDARVQRDARSGNERHAVGLALACTGARGCSDARSGVVTGRRLIEEHVHELARAGDAEHLGVRACDECTVHPRAR
ncbi:hypothetical protein CRG98_008771 [Punica granatum]|uniref:Uncharacterized protein n=1 Tax=Punica granatum TaxID=22663 RepID=A0A2I0KRF0_PUNGR|nr:hypothetical protein CRG98_008771 [Punica granatum]